MRKILIQDDLNAVEKHLKQFEINTGCELLIVVADTSDPYPAASLRFGIISSFLLSLTLSYYYHFENAWPWPVLMLVLTLIFTWIGHFPWAKKLALSDWEINRECREKALEYFHTLGTSKVSHKVTAMIMLSIFEHNIQVLVDEKLQSKLDSTQLNELIKVMQNHFSRGNIALGLMSSISLLEEKILKQFSGKVSELPPSELCDTVHFINHS
jgi:uncharacterized membrane protein